MDTALKHRLTGAVILVFLAVLLLPELLTGRGMNAGSETGASSGELRRVEIDLGGEAPAAPLPAPEPVVQLPTPQPTPPSEAEASAPQPSPPEPDPQPAAEPDVAAAPAEPAPAQPAPAAAPLSASAGGYFVQVGVFSSTAAAERVARRLRDQGFTAVVSRYTTGQQMYRVRVGPQANRAEARQVADRLKAIGQKSPFIVVPDS